MVEIILRFLIASNRIEMALDSLTCLIWMSRVSAISVLPMDGDWGQLKSDADRAVIWNKVFPNLVCKAVIQNERSPRYAHRCNQFEYRRRHSII
jgi:hypothetical protein